MPFSAQTANDPLLADWQIALTSLRDQTRALVDPLTQVDRARTPAAGAWSVDQILEHLSIANRLYVVVMQRALTVQANRATSRHPAWKPTMIGSLLRRAVDPSAQRKLPAPRRARPGPTVRAHVLTRFTDGVDDLRQLMQDADGVDLRAVRFPSPFASILRLNLGDGFAICVAHTARHVKQIERTIERVS